MYSRKQAEKIVLDKVCDGVREEDIAKLEKSAVNSHQKISYRALLRGASEYEHGWIFSTCSGGFDKVGNSIKHIGSGNFVSFNRMSAKIQQFDWGGHSPFLTENFKRSGDIHKGCSGKTLYVRISEWDKETPTHPEFVKSVKAILSETLTAHSDHSSEAISDLVKTVFPQPDGGYFFLEMKSELDARSCSEKIGELTVDLMIKHDFYWIEITCMSFPMSELRRSRGK